MVDAGLLGSVCKIVCRRNDVAIEAEVKRTVLTTSEARQTLSISNIWQFGDGAASQIQIQNLWNPDTLTELIEKLKQMDKNEVRGILLDLRNVAGCDGDTAVRIAALFMDKGVIAHRILIQPDGTLVMHTWEAKDGKVQLTTKGPFKVNSDGAIDPEPAKTPQVEMLDWESNVYKNTVVAIMSNETSGGGEVIAAGLMADFKRHVVTSEYLSAGKGTYQSYFQVGPEHVIALSTAFYLRPDGTPFEKGADGKGMMPNGIPRGNFRSIEEFANHLLEERLSVVPVPDLPPEPKPEPKTGPEVKK
jgi:C-terminal processing protease CtpA/Prc